VCVTLIDLANKLHISMKNGKFVRGSTVWEHSSPTDASGWKDFERKMLVSVQYCVTLLLTMSTVSEAPVSVLDRKMPWGDDRCLVRLDAAGRRGRRPYTVALSDRFNYQDVSASSAFVSALLGKNSKQDEFCILSASP